MIKIQLFGLKQAKRKISLAVWFKIGSKKKASSDQIDVERPIKWILMSKKDEALFGWIDVERPIKWTLI